MKTIFSLRLTATFILLTIVNSTYGQFTTVNTNTDRRNIRATHAEDEVTGERYLTNDWQPAVIKFANNPEPLKISIKYDLYTDEVVVKGDDEKEMTFAEPISAFRLVGADGKEKLFRANYASSGQNTAKSFYEVLYDGKTQLLKKHKKTILESRVYNSGVVGKKFVDDTEYYLAMDGKLMGVKSNINALTAALPAKSAELKRYAQEHKLNLKKEDDLVDLITYYNTL